MSAGSNRVVLLTLAVAAVAVFGPTGVASGKSTGTSQPTLTLERDCEAFPGFNSVNATLTGFPPFTSFEATLDFPVGGSVGPVAGTTDAFGNWDSRQAGQIGVAEVGTWTATVVWSGATLIKSLYVDCSQPDRPTSKGECKSGGWRHFDFKNQGQCVAFVQRGAGA